MNWKKLPLRAISIGILQSKGKKHKGQYRVAVWKSALGFGKESKPQFFNTKIEALEFIAENFDSLTSWID